MWDVFAQFFVLFADILGHTNFKLHFLLCLLKCMLYIAGVGAMAGVDDIVSKVWSVLSHNH